MQTNFDLLTHERAELLQYLVDELKEFYDRTGELKVTADLDIARVLSHVKSFDLENPVDGREALSSVLSGMKEHTVHTPHPMYYGLYNPRANLAGIMADIISAVMNPQLAAWSHSPYANEVEKYMVETFGIQFGFKGDSVDGVFAAGGAEANFTAILCALNHAFPEAGTLGLQGIGKQPVIYCSAETHHSILKGARMAGLGSGSVKMISVDDRLKINTRHLASEIENDRLSGKQPMMVVATAGTTGTGTIDNLEEIGKICNNLGVWYHVDAAYGGACIMNHEFRNWISGIELSQSLIVDLHKWFSVPMAASMFITNDRTILHRTFRTVTEYMPRDAYGMQITDPFAHSFQWSRRFSGLKIYLSLLLFGRSGYSEVIGHQVDMANYLRKLLGQDRWTILNDTPLPVVCFTDPLFQDDPEFAKVICEKVVKSGEAWISVYPVGGTTGLRACITNYNTGEEHIQKLVDLLRGFRNSYPQKEGSLHQNIFLITGEIQVGKTTFLGQLVDSLKYEDVKISGFLSQGSFRHGERNGFTLIDTGSGKSYPLASTHQMDGWVQFRRFYFNPEALEKGNQILFESLKEKPDLVVVDEVGPMEMEGQGWWKAIEMLSEEYNMCQIWVVRENILKDVQQRWNISAQNVIRVNRDDPTAKILMVEKIKQYINP